MPLLVAAIAALAVRLDRLVEIDKYADDLNSIEDGRVHPEDRRLSVPHEATAVSQPARRQEGEE